MRDPYTDLEINCRSQLSILEACRHHNPSVEGRLRRHAPDLRPARVPAGRRGAPDRARPTSTASTRRPASGTTSLYNNVFGIRACSLRLTNIYGPRMLVKDARQAFLGFWFRPRARGTSRSDLRRRLAAARLRLRRRRGATRSCSPARATRRTARCSTSAATRSISLRELAELLVELAGSAVVRARAVPGRQEGDRHRQLLRATSRKIRDELGWAPTVALREGLRDGRSSSTASTARHYWDETRDVPFLDLARQTAALAVELDDGDRGACSTSGWFVARPEVERVRAGVRRLLRRGARGRRRDRHRRDRARSAGARHRRRATK